MLCADNQVYIPNVSQLYQKDEWAMGKNFKNVTRTMSCLTFVCPRCRTLKYGGALALNIKVYLSDRLALIGNVRVRCLWGNAGSTMTRQGGNA